MSFQPISTVLVPASGEVFTPQFNGELIRVSSYTLSDLYAIAIRQIYDNDDEGEYRRWYFPGQNRVHSKILKFPNLLGTSIKLGISQYGRLKSGNFSCFVEVWL